MIRQFWKLWPELSQRKMKRKRKSICFYLHPLYSSCILSLELSHWSNKYSLNQWTLLQHLKLPSLSFLCWLTRSFQLHKVFNLDNDNGAEDTPTLIDRKVRLILWKRFSVVFYPLLTKHNPFFLCPPSRTMSLLFQILNQNIQCCS